MKRRPVTTAADSRHIAVVTGTRAEFGLLRSVMRAIRARKNLRLSVIVTGEHLLPPARTIDEVGKDFDIAATVDMQFAGETSRTDDARALGRGISGLVDAFAPLAPDVVLVLGDRIEAFAAAAAASVMGIRVAHLHGGDRAQGVADEAIRHAITKLAHIHLPATALSTERIISMGEEVASVHLVGSPAIDDLPKCPAATDEFFRKAGKPEMIFLMHPIGRSEEEEFNVAQRVLSCCMSFGSVLALHPNHDPGREGILRAIVASRCPHLPHLSRKDFIGLLRRTNLIVGNSSAGLIEAAAIGAWCINIGPRQGGRERPGNVTDIADLDPHVDAIDAALQSRLFQDPWKGKHPYGDGHTGVRVAELLATLDPDKHPLRKENSY